MGIIKAASGSLSGTLADQWLEYYSMSSLPEGVLAMRAEKRVSERSANTKGEENCISDGSTILVSPGQCALAIDRGEITGVYDQPGENIYHSKRSPSIFHKGGVKGIIRQSFDRFGYGGVAAIYQVIIYLDVRERFGNPFAVSYAINLTDRGRNVSLDATVTLSGMFSFKITEPAVFYKNICGNSCGTVMTADIMPQLRTELESLLRSAMTKLCGTEGISAYGIGGSADELSAAVAALANDKWRALRGYELTSVAIDGISIAQGDKDLLQSVQIAKALTDPKLAAGTLIGAQAQAMKNISQNTL